MATASAVKLKTGHDAHACWIESLDNGWLFLLPVGEQSAWLLSVGGLLDKMLAESRLVADQIVEVNASPGKFPAHPRIADPLCGEGWLACGTAALGFDPLCGDGAGNAVREAILASAAVSAIADGADVAAVLAHYRTRLLGGFKRHLEICQEFYSRGRRGDWWDQEMAALQLGVEWATQELANAPASRYRLNGFALEALASR
jgi:flavin-dependent dehydrogenase